MKNKTLVLGVGNYLLSDDGLSVHVLEQLQSRYEFPEEVQVVDGGTCSLDLLHFLEGITNLIIIDAIDAGLEPGSFIRLTGDEIPAYLAVKISPHDIALPDLLAAAKLRDLYPQNIVILGLQPQSLETSVDLSPAVAANLDLLVEKVYEEVNLALA